jgi:prevent-host-death family protein
MDSPNDHMEEKPVSTVTLAEAKARLSHLLAQVEAGEEVVITKRAQPVARLSQFEKSKVAGQITRRVPGTDAAVV